MRFPQANFRIEWHHILVSARRLVYGTVKRTLLEFAGWALLLAGIAALVLPGPGLLMIFFGVAVLAPHYRWAHRILDGVERRAKQAARESVETWPRIIIGVLGGVWLAVCGVVWWFGLVNIPVISAFGVTIGPDLPFEGWVTGAVLLASAVVAWVLIADSMRRYRFGAAGTSSEAPG